MKPPSNLSQKNQNASALDLPNALGSDPLFCEFLNNGYEWIRVYPECLADLGDSEYPYRLRKRFYASDEPAYHERIFTIYVHVANLYRIPGYPKDGSAPRFLFTVRMSYQNGEAGIPLGVVDMRWRAQSVEEAEKPARWFWQQLGEPMP